jgi:hypothetical protein
MASTHDNTHPNPTSLLERSQRMNALSAAAEEETKIGGDPAKGLVLALLALAEATRLNEPHDRIDVEVGGALTVDS